MPFKARKPDTQVVLCAVAVLAFIVSLALPACVATALGKPDTISGLWALVWSVIFGYSSVSVAFEHPEAFLLATMLAEGCLALAAILNFLFIAIPAAVWSNVTSKTTWRWLAAASVFTLASGLIVPTLYLPNVPRLLSGYFVWLLGHLLLLVIAVLRIRSLRTTS